MPIPSTPASSPLPRDDSAVDILTPGRKVQALLAQFDDSDSDTSIQPRDSGIPSQHSQSTPLPGLSLSEYSEALAAAGDGENDEEEDLPVLRRGRLARRLDSPVNGQDLQASLSGSDGSPGERWAIERVFLRTDGSQLQQTVGSSEDELSRPAATRQLLLKRKRDPTSATPSSSSPSQDASPSFSTTGVAAASTSSIPRKAHDANLDPDEAPQAPAPDGNNKFLALVEKHRKQRLAMEAAEIAKRAARVEELDRGSRKARIERGSSMADSSGDDTVLSDEDAGSRLAKQARPTRRASKKVLEEMNRETQRMNRNMQLTHQARTKKKITKESLLARFNFPVSVATNSINEGTKSFSASSVSTSDVEGAKEHVTPPTSPLGGDHEATKTVMLNRVDHEELPDLAEAMSQPISASEKGKGRAIDTMLHPTIDIREPVQIRPVRVKWSKQDAVMVRGTDSDSDLEIITSQGNTRKYAVFERMPSRKAHETESHLVLRNLAHLGGESRDKKRSSMNAAEMEASLRRAARLQAQRERQGKIEELRAKGIIIQTSEEREREQQEVEDLVEKARQEGAEIQKREKEAAKKDGTYVKDAMDDDDDDDEEEDEDFEDDEEMIVFSGSEAELGAEASEDEESGAGADDLKENVNEADLENGIGLLLDDVADEQDSEDLSEEADEQENYGSEEDMDVENDKPDPPTAAHKPRQSRVVVDDDEDEDEPVAPTPLIPTPAKTPRSLTHSTRKVIPGLQMSNDSPMGLTQAFAATMADSQSAPSTPGSQAQDSLATMRDLPSPDIPMIPRLQRLESLDFISDSQPAMQTQPLNLNFSETQPLLQSPALGFSITGTPLVQSQMPFEPTQDAGYMLSPFAGSRFGADTPQNEPDSTIDTVLIAEGSPLVQRKGRLRRGAAERVASDDEDAVLLATQNTSAFDVMHRAAQQKATMPEFDKSKSNARDIVDEAAEESEDEYAGLGGASDDDVGEEDEEDRQMIDHDTQVGKGDEAKLAGLYADRERQQDEAAVSKLLKDITTGALRRKRGVGEDLDLSDEEDEAARRREAKRREYAKMRRELFKDEAVEKISEDKKKEAFLKSIEDRDELEDEDAAFDEEETQEDDSQSKNTQGQDVDDSLNESMAESAAASSLKWKRPLEPANESQTNRLPPALRRGVFKTGSYKKPSTLAEIRDSVSFLIEEPDSQSMTIDLGLSDSEDEPEKYLDLDRHLTAADENDDDAEDLGDFIVDDSQKDDADFKMPGVPASTRAPYSERRTKARNVVDRLSLTRQASSSSCSSKAGGKMAFFASKTSSVDMQFGKVPNLLRRATTNSSLGGMVGREESGTGVTVPKERGHAGDEKAFVRKGTGGQRNAVNYCIKPAESKMSERAGVKKTAIGKAVKGKKGGFLGGLFRGDSWA